MKCKNNECSNEIIGKRVYCSLACRNIYVNKYLRNYGKVSDFHKIKREKMETEYLKNPKKCKKCDNIICFEKKDNEFCNHSCSASFNNKEHTQESKDNISKSIIKHIEEIGPFGFLKNEHRFIKKINKNKIDVEFSFKCEYCNAEFLSKRKKKYCSKNCILNKKINNKKIKLQDVELKLYNVELKLYRTYCNFKFNLADYKDEFDFSLIEKYGWYSPTNKNNNLNGISRDHMLSVREGFELGINPKIISHPANCKLMIHRDNISKNKKSSITFEELLERIKKFEEKYKN